MWPAGRQLSLLGAEYTRRIEAFVLPVIRFDASEGSAAIEGHEPPILSYQLNAGLLRHQDWIAYLLNSLDKVDTYNDGFLEDQKESLIGNAKNHSQVIENHIRIAWSRTRLSLTSGENFPTYINCSKGAAIHIVLFLT